MQQNKEPIGPNISNGVSKCIEDLKRMIKKGTSPYHVVRESAGQLQEAGFQELPWPLAAGEEWHLAKGGAYFVTPFRTSLLAFRIGEDYGGSQKDSGQKDSSQKDGSQSSYDQSEYGQQLRIVSAHVDSPGLRIKAKAEYPYKSYARVNCEVYGGVINHTWTDRPLGMAGIVAVAQSNRRGPHLHYLDCGRPVFIVPNLSIHMNREINKGTELNPQVDLIPLGGLHPEPKEAFFTAFLAEELSRTGAAAVRPEDIISYDLGLYIVQDGTYCGMRQDLFAAPRLDNLTSVRAGIAALTESGRRGGLNVLALFDHEEIGSRSKTGGAGNLLPFVLERIFYALGCSRDDYLRGVMGGFLLSADAAHAVNPNRPEKYDPTSGIYLGDGVVIKCAAKQSYAGDAETWAVLQDWAAQNQIPCCFSCIRSDIPGGSTLGPIISAALPMQSADIGVPLLAMHSAVETMGCCDQYYFEQFLKGFFSRP